jgi:predicted Zn-dependent protease
MSKRLAVLEKMTAAPNADPFAWYGLAMEYRSLGRLDDAIRTFETLRGRDPSYVAMYLMAAQVLSEQGRRDEARTWAQDGIAQAHRKGDTHAAGELESLLAGL